MIPAPKEAAKAMAGQVEVLLPAAVGHGFDYLAPPGSSFHVGDFVRVPFGKKEQIGIVLGPGHVDANSKKLKVISQKLEELPPLSAALLEFARWMAWYNLVPLGAVLKMILPFQDIEKKPRKGAVAYLANHTAHTIPDLAKLSSNQEQAASMLKAKLQKGFSVSLLDGITGSGKTEVYFDAIAEVLSAPHSQCLILLPEIALSIQWLQRFETRFGFTPLVWNSEVPHAKKRAIWQAAAKGEARVLVGARSALFLPYKNLALTVIDEEHDTSYKQEEGVIYHARDMAVARARFEKIPVVLVSATPSLETYYNAKQGKYQEICLDERHGGAVLPGLSMIDMRSAKTERGGFISEPLRTALAKTLANGHQSMLFLNRRGYAPLMLCRTCGHRFQCPDCSSWLVLHQKKNATTNYLQCHHCNHRISVPKHCPACNTEDSLHPCGPGVDRLQEEVERFLPDARVAVLASDHTESMRDLTQVIDAMGRHEIDILIGTQMIAKGHHFGKLATVGVVDADLGLAGGDLRAAERTYQLLHQLSGRAGREETTGHVYLQSFLPEHPVMQALMDGGRDAFLNAELEARENANMPPFSRLAAIIVEGTKEDVVIKTAKHLAEAANHQETSPQLLGPAPAPLYLLRGKFRWRLLLRAGRAINLPDYVENWISAVPIPSSVRLKVDMDPISFL